jgi:uncharacterized protein YacL
LDQVKKVEVWAVRVAFASILGALAAALHPAVLPALPALAVGIVLGGFVIALEFRLRQVALPHLLGGAAGMLAGVVLGILLLVVFDLASLQTSANGRFLFVAIPLSCAYLGMLVGFSKAGILNLSAVSFFNSEIHAKQSIKLLDTSVIIDGRIADIAESGFLDGSLVIPQFVLRELQLVADSADSAKRNRGRRGLDIVQRLQKMPNIDIQLSGYDVPSVKEVDLKLIEFAKVHHCRIVTNDFNLNKVAQVHGVEVLNINELANSLKPVVLPGEIMRVFILKEGKEHNQGVAYLDDGTMVVVDNAKRCISRTIDITVTSVLQTTAGKMIFGKFDERSDRNLHVAVAEKHSVASAAQHALAEPRL